MRNFILSSFILAMNSCTPALAQQGVLATYIGITPTALPAVCNQGDLRFDIGSSQLQLCTPANTWGAIGGGGGLTPIAAYSVLANNTAGAALPIANQSLMLGTPAISDTDIVFQATKSVNSYYQSVIQNTNNGNAASADYVVNNDQGTATTFYGDYGINSSTFSGTGSLSLPNATYLYAKSGDLALGTASATGIHFVINSSATDALAISNAGTVSIPAFGTAGVVLNNASGQLSSTAGPLAIASGGTGQITASAAFNALSPITTTGDLVLGNGANSATRLAIGTNGFVLKSNGTTASWQSVVSGGGIQVATQATAAAGVSSTLGSPIIFPTTLFDTASAYNAGTGVYTCQYTGYYLVTLTGMYTGSPGAAIGLFKNGSYYLGFGYTQTQPAGYSMLVDCSVSGTLAIVTTSASVTFLGTAEYQPTVGFTYLSSILPSSAGIVRTIVNIAAPTTAGAVAATDYYYNVSGTTTLTLPTAVSNTNLYVVKNTGANTVTVATTGGQTIDGSATASLPVANTSLHLISDGSNWRIQ